MNAVLCDHCKRVLLPDESKTGWVEVKHTRAPESIQHFCNWDCLRKFQTFPIQETQSSVWVLSVPDKHPATLLDNAGYFSSRKEAEQFAIKMELYGSAFEIPPVGGFKQPINENKTIFDKFESAKLQQELSEIVEKKMRFVNENREELIQAFVAKTGVQPDEAVLCEQRMQDGEIKLWVRKKGEIEKMIDQKNLGAEIWVIILDESEKLILEEGFFTDENTAIFRCDLLGDSFIPQSLKKIFHGEQEPNAC